MSSPLGAVKLAFHRLISRHRRGRATREIVAAYLRRPQSEDELAGVDAATRDLVGDEPW